MARCPIEELKDLKVELSKIGQLPGVQEQKPGIFYLKRQGFLHFHLKDGRRWADVRDGKAWGPEIEIPKPSTALQRAAFLKEVVARHQRTYAK